MSTTPDIVVGSGANSRIVWRSHRGTALMPVVERPHSEQDARERWLAGYVSCAAHQGAPNVKAQVRIRRLETVMVIRRP